MSVIWADYEKKKKKFSLIAIYNCDKPNFFWYDCDMEEGNDSSTYWPIGMNVSGNQLISSSCFMIIVLSLRTR